MIYTLADSPAGDFFTSCFILGIPLLLILIGSIFWVWMLIDAVTKEPSGTEKIVWVLVILFGHLLGALIYYFVRRRNRTT